MTIFKSLFQKLRDAERRSLKPTKEVRKQVIELDVSVDEIPLVSTQSTKGVVYTSYNTSSPPPRPERAHTRLCLISDTHMTEFLLPSSDVLIHAGDLTNYGSEGQLREVMEWIGSAPAEMKIVIAGNHDILMDQTDGWYEENYNRWHAKPETYDNIKNLFRGPEADEKGIYYLETESCEFESPNGRTWKVYGSPWTPNFGNMAFNYYAKDAEEVVSQYEQAYILITHGPPKGILDRNRLGQECGCPVLLSHVQNQRLSLHVFGHIHEARGAKVIDDTIFVNAACKPYGPKKNLWLDETRTAMTMAMAGGQGWQPIIVDMYD